MLSALSVISIANNLLLIGLYTYMSDYARDICHLPLQQTDKYYDTQWAQHPSLHHTNSANHAAAHRLSLTSFPSVSRELEYNTLAASIR